MVIKVGINSFGRIGRVILRTCCQNSEIEVVAINDPAIDPEYMCYLIKFDSTHGKYSGDISYQDNEIKVNGRSVKVFHHKEPRNIPWHQAGVQYVVEASGMFTNLEKAAGHLSSDTVRRVIVTAPSGDVPMLILGVNENRVQPDVKVISCASSTIYCLAPIMKVLEDAFGVGEGSMTSIHAMTPSLKPLDGLCMRGKHWRDHRSIHQNIIPATTGACKALGKIIPSCKDKLVGLAFRVPIVNVSVLDMSIRLDKNTTITGISQAIQRIKNPALRNVIQISNEKSVSSDFIGDPHSCTLDIDSSMQITPHFFKLICWYENEYSYSCRVVETILLSERQFQTRIPSPISITCNRSIALKASSKFQIAERKETNVNRQCVLLPGSKLQLQNNRPTIQADAHNLVVRPVTAVSTSGTTIFNRPLDPKTKAETIRSYIDKLTKCKCNAVQSKIGTNMGPKTIKRAKTREFLKTVEKEISAMLTMTEELLNRSANKKSSTETHPFKEPTEKELSALRNNIIKKISDTLEKVKKEKCNHIVEFNRDRKSLRLDVDDYRDKMDAREVDSLNNSESKIRESNISCKIQMENIVESNLAMKAFNPIHKKYLRKREDIPDLNQINNNPLAKTNKPQVTKELELQITKMYTPLIEVKPEQGGEVLSVDRANIQEKDDTDNEVIIILSENLEPAIKLLNENTQDNVNVSDTNNVQNNSNNHKRNASISHYEFNVNPLTKENVTRSASVADICNTKIKLKVEPVCAKVIKQRRIEAEKNVTENTFVDDDNVQDQSSSTAQENNHRAIAGCSSNQKLEKFTSYELDNNFKDLRSIISDLIVPIQAKKNGNTDRNSPDIYDKLDSASVTDSDSSYRIQEKTSEIINITDLTYSLEDLERLDKICRVIEISDELSDKLFSVLDNENYNDTSSNKWSFKDFCQRIKFDEFCKDLFEKSAL